MELSDLKGIGPTRLKAFHAAGIRSLRDLLYALPAKYRDTTHESTVRDAQPGEKVCLNLAREGEAKLFRKGKLCRVTCSFSDETGLISAVWFNQSWMKQTLDGKLRVRLYGTVEIYGGRKQLMNPSVETEARIIPVYRPLEGVPQKTHENAVSQALPFAEILSPETLPQTLLARYGLVSSGKAIRALHHPESMEELEEAKRRFGFEQMLLYQAAVRYAGTRQPAVAAMKKGSPEAFWARMPFTHTAAPRRTLEEIAADLTRETAMSRMVQGDVGCGKTAVAMGAMLLAAENGFQSALMVPTEILARQHYHSMKAFFENQGYPCGLLLGGMTAAERKSALEKIRSGEWRIVIGTHALIGKQVEYPALGLCITDEQHRFGVAQRSALIGKGSVEERKPHLLVMSATPIPRSLALVLFGDLDISVIDELPPGRIPVRTRIVPEAKREDMYGFIRNALSAGKQAYFVCPLVEKSEGEDSLKAARDHAEELQEKVFPDFRVGMTYGSQPPAEKAQVLDAFSAGDLEVLVSTTVIEVGVNVPNAAIMVIEDADRYGLASLHQLRGRVGRGSGESWCFLLAAPNERLRTLVSTNDGFQVAQADLEQRGPGELLGTRQHGDALLPGGASVYGNMKLLYEAADCARELFEDPALEEERDNVSVQARALVASLSDRVSIS